MYLDENKINKNKNKIKTKTYTRCVVIIKVYF